MSTKNKFAKHKNPVTASPISAPELIKTTKQGPLSNIAEHILPGTEPVSERTIQVRKQTSTFNGPIPHPEIFRKYGEVIPDAPERILKVFEEDSRHVRDIQMAALNAQKGDNRRVHWMAYSLIAGGYFLSAFFSYMDKDLLAGTILTTTLAGTIAGFFQTRQEEKSKNDQPQE